MIRRATIELDEDLVSEARAVLDQPTLRASLEEALRRAIRSEKLVNRNRRRAQIDEMKRASPLIDHDVLASGQAWQRQ